MPRSTPPRSAKGSSGDGASGGSPDGRAPGDSRGNRAPGGSRAGLAPGDSRGGLASGDPRGRRARGDSRGGLQSSGPRSGGSARDGEEGTAALLIPAGATLDQVREAAAECRACPLWERGTQTVFGAGPRQADVVLVGEQPGDREDVEGEPFVGPAGRLLDEALAAAGIERRRAYVTNVVKHFKWEARGKRRIHQKPNAAEIRACRPWLDAELARIQPRVVVCLGATAAQALLGRGFKVTVHGGTPLTATGIAPVVVATIHPSAILRARDDESRRAGLRQLVEDLTVVARALDQPRADHSPPPGAVT